jgi:hypothetical protein
VYACETVPVIAQAAEQIIAANGFADRISVIPKTSTALVLGQDLPTRADVLVCEIFDTGLLSEGVIPVLEHARRELLRPDAAILPRGATVYAALVESAALRAEDEVATAAGFDVSGFNAFADTCYSQRNLQHYPHRQLSSPLPVFTFDFHKGPVLDETRTLRVAVTDAGHLDAVVFWFVLDLDGQHRITTEPQAESCWRQAVQLVPPRNLTAGDVVALTAKHDGNMIFFEIS